MLWCEKIFAGWKNCVKLQEVLEFRKWLVKLNLEEIIII